MKLLSLFLGMMVLTAHGSSIQVLSNVISFYKIAVLEFSQVSRYCLKDFYCAVAVAVAEAANFYVILVNIFLTYLLNYFHTLFTIAKGFITLVLFLISFMVWYLHFDNFVFAIFQLPYFFSLSNLPEYWFFCRAMRICFSPDYAILSINSNFSLLKPYHAVVFKFIKMLCFIYLRLTT